MKIDLGCGTQKNPGFIGIDKKDGPGVDIVCDILQGIPLPDDSADCLFAVHSLPYIDPLLDTMKEIYRICKHKAIVCIVAPYAHTYFHAANPHYKSWFNEYSPFYFTGRLLRETYWRELITPYAFPSHDMDREPPDYDFQLLRMEFFYSMPFKTNMYDEEERTIVRHIQPNVVDEIMYHFLVVKQPLTVDEIEDMAMRSLEEPMQITNRRRERPESGQQLDAGQLLEKAPSLNDTQPPVIHKRSSSKTKSSLRHKKTGMTKGRRMIKKQKAKNGTK
ncbi:methyltransferase domain-containing protein [Paenibacillus sp. OAS669]|uniref:methyltransferase domain-containing protein n=1 Tax=Paenibacillus sp. OAS669 TaxID=2663821 RepID=UPI00178B9719|nr:methyltransferase domain-containing protein [Paenibacillus sp. OAS669]MBE1441141.1 SAM-dependent methyltransferase [Paenibacillus sp. OAS669]